jgi:chorismate mutase
MAVRAIRGATHVDADEPDGIMVAVAELVTEMLSVNSVPSEDVISMILTSTPDLVSVYPATAARLAGLEDVPLLSACEVAVPGSMPRVVRVMAHVESDLARSEVQHVYLRGTEGLRKAAAPQ